jgi:hypothetical protein
MLGSANDFLIVNGALKCYFRFGSGFATTVIVLIGHQGKGA